MSVKRIMEVQPGGPGAGPWYLLALRDGISGVVGSTVEGGGQEYTDQYGRSFEEDGELVPITTLKTGTPSPFTYTVEIPENQARAWFQRLEGKKSMRARPYCDDYTNTLEIAPDIGALVLSNSLSTGDTDPLLVDDTQDVADARRIALPQRASGKFRLYPVEHTNISGTVTALAINDIIRLGRKRIALGGDCCGDNVNRDGTEEWLACTASPGAGIPELLYTDDGGATWGVIDLTGLTDANVVALTKAGSNIIIAATGTGAGMWYVPLQDVIDNVGGSVTPIDCAGVSGAINDVHAVTSLLVYACGAAGAVYVSTDGGRTFASAGSAATASALNKITHASEQLIWIGGASGALVKIERGTMSLVTDALLVDGILAVAVPNALDRKCEVFLGTAGGEIIKSTNKGGTFTSIFDAGAGSIDALDFAGPGGQIMFAVQSEAGGDSRVLRDHTGGAMTTGQYDILGSYASPANSGINALAAANANFAMVVGAVENSQGYIGKVD